MCQNREMIYTLTEGERPWAAMGAGRGWAPSKVQPGPAGAHPPPACVPRPAVNVSQNAGFAL